VNGQLLTHPIIPVATVRINTENLYPLITANVPHDGERRGRDYPARDGSGQTRGTSHTKHGNGGRAVTYRIRNRFPGEVLQTSSGYARPWFHYGRGILDYDDGGSRPVSMEG